MNKGPFIYYTCYPLQFGAHILLCLKCVDKVELNLLKSVSLLLAVRGITCISYNIYHSKKLKLCLLNNDFKVRPSKVTYLGYI